MSYSSNAKRFDNRGWGQPDSISSSQIGDGWRYPPTSDNGGWEDDLPSISLGAGRGPLDRRVSYQQSFRYESRGNNRGSYDVYAADFRPDRAQCNRASPPQEQSVCRMGGHDINDRYYQNSPATFRQSYDGQAYRADKQRAMHRSTYYCASSRGWQKDNNDQYYNDEDCLAAENYQSEEYAQEERHLPYQLRSKGAPKPEPKLAAGHGPTSVSTKLLQKIPGTKDLYEDLSQNGIEYAYYFLRLINYELEEMENQYFKKIIRKKIQELINGGMVLLAMIGRCREQYFGYNQFEFSLGNGEKLPYCHFGRGDMVFLSRESPFTGKPYEMMVLNKTRNTITLISRDDIPDLLEGCWRIDPSISVITHKRMEGAIMALTRTGFIDEGEVESKYEQWGKERRLLEEEKFDTDETASQDDLSDAITSCIGTFVGSTLADVLLSASPKDKAEPPAVTLEKCPGLYEWANSDADESYAPIHSLQHWRCNDASESVPFTDTYRHEVKLNSSQLEAVKSAIKHRFSLIHGPPGTGKTTTIAMLVQILLCSSEDLKILLCAKTHVAVDNMLDSLRKHHIDALRLGMIARVREDLIEYALEYKVANYRETLEQDSLREKAESEDSDSDASPTEREISALITRMINKEINSARVICATCVGAGTNKLKDIRFDVVIIDEGSQSTEPESIIPIVRGAKHAVIVGDHKQLKPFVASLDAKYEGLSMSMFERMMILDVPSVMLDTQYRMHPCIGEISSQIFYHGKVKHGVKAEDRLPPFLSKLKKDFREKSLDSSPYIVINLKHSQEEQGMGGSLKNEEEANIVLNVLDDLLASNDEESSRLHVKPGHIGIITPYLEQRRLIHDLISENERFKDIKLQGFALDEDIHMPDNDNLLEIHTVDGFQGREKEIIIMSTVRSDPCHGIGFLKDWRRLNVACTRARRQFILVCNVEILSRDRYWARFINWTKTHPEAIFVSAHRYMQNDNNDREEEKRVNDTSNDDDYASTFF